MSDMAEEPGAPPKTGRPSDYSEALAETICLLLISGDDGKPMSLRSICARDDMPDKSTVLRWLGKHDAFRDQYARARETQADAFAEDILDIADDSSGDWKATEGEDVNAPPVMVVDHEHIARSRLRVDTRKWLMSKMAPKKYGEKVTQEVTGLDGAPLAATIILTGRPEPAPAPQAVAGVRDSGH